MRVVHDRLGESDYRMTGDDTERWAELTVRDCSSYLLRRSDGRVVGGELPWYWVQNWMLRWVVEGL